jgi:7,8-dihydropterin-6-yl-methyl-4-(beta-D-ribofuranosyl)aminobenzene 5'-phosphate synthase
MNLKRQEVTTMRVKILFDKATKNKKLYTGWGVSFLVNDSILFDAGENSSWLMRNMEILKVNINKLDAIVISHDHWDHQGGLWGLLQKRKGLPVYACPKFSTEFKNKVIKLKGTLQETKNITMISKDIFVSGEIDGEYKGSYISEQALVVKTLKGISIITGCAHPGIITMIEKIKKKFKEDHIYSVIGGFHLIDKDTRIVEMIARRFKEMNIEKVGPTHCSGKTAEDIFKHIYGSDFLSLQVGQVLDI